VLSEVGGFLAPATVAEEHRDVLYQFYGSFETTEELLQKYTDLMRGIASLNFLAGFCYTQLTDIEQETNGLLTYDRQPKVPVETIRNLHRELFDQANSRRSEDLTPAASELTPSLPFA
jgi:hypothetical protein